MNSIPREAYSYWPSTESCLIETKYLVERLVFSRQNYKDWELSALSQLEKIIKDKPFAETFDTSEKLRFLYGTGWNLNLTVKVIEAHVQWKQDWPSYKLVYPLITSILNSGGIYIHGRDHKYRPIIIVTPKLLLEFPQHLLMATAYFLLEYIKDHMFLQGQIENLILLIDLKNFEIKDFISKFITDLQTHYPCRLANAFLLNTNKSIQGFLKYFSSNTIQKLTIVKKQSILMKTCNPTQIEEKYGGSAENLRSFWPPAFPSSNYKAESDPVEGFLSNYSSYDEYFLQQPKIFTDLSSLKISQFEDKESFISYSEFKDEMWQKLDVISGSFSFLHTDICGKVQDTEQEGQLKVSRLRGKSEDITRTSSNVAKKMSIEHELMESNCCIENTCSVF
ncbi:hypothetical protein SteCoe_18775 [Stentor coeruleus]|uniref:CRAL-TRIO domain-containing protein n=1 Tax=Stentor coeruleus TaxID=5963 RepID=A0A1R2BVL7_9CILI|nr:hypothetical protein SteCoe_18775 [Stentor coeruleus]